MNETWNIRTDCDKMEKLISNTTHLYNIKRTPFLKKTSSYIKQSIFFLRMIAFLTLWTNRPRPNWKIHMDW